LTKSIVAAYKNYFRLTAWTKGSKEENRVRPFTLLLYVDQLTKVLTSRKRTNCGIGCGNALINPYGYVYPCTDMRDKRWCFGNIQILPLKKIYERMLNWQVAITVDKINACKECEIRYVCGGGCRACAFHTTGDIMGKDPHCNFLYEHISDKLWSVNL
jgi:radical SAM protein with 4Fe4S-binding SPASM domain